MAYSDDVLALSPNSYHRLEETSGTSLSDETGGGNTGTNVGCDLNVAGLLSVGGSAASFDGVDDRIETTDEISIGSEGTIVFIMNRVNPENASHYVFDNHTGADRTLMFDSGNDDYTIFIGGTDLLENIASSATLNDGNDHHFAVRWGSFGVELYVDGTVTDSTVTTAPTNFTFRPKWGSRYTNVEAWEGVLDELAVWDSALSQAQIESLNDSATGAAGTTGTLAETEEADSLAASGTVTPPEVTGTVAETEADDTLAASGTLVYTGSLTETETDDTLAASGTVVNNIGSLAETEDADTLAASGESKVTGSLAETEDDDSLSATGHLTYSGSVAETEEDDSLAASGSVGEGISGSLAETEEDDSLSATGVLGYSGTLAETEEDDTLSATGTFGEGFFGTLAETEENDTLNASGTSTPPEVTGSLSETEDDDSLAAAGTSTGLVGTLAETEEDDALTASGTLGYAGTLAETEADDTLSASGTFTGSFTGTLAVTEEDDTLAASGVSAGVTFWETAPVGYTTNGVAHTRTPVAYTPADPDEPALW